MITSINYVEASQSEYYWYYPFDVSEIVDSIVWTWVDSYVDIPDKNINDTNDFSKAVDWLNNPKVRLKDIIDSISSINNVTVLGLCFDDAMAKQSIEIAREEGGNIQNAILDITDTVWQVWFSYNSSYGYYIPEGYWEFDKYNGVGTDELTILIENM